jgi:capsular polysaccharide biosynthesis protein
MSEQTLDLRVSARLVWRHKMIFLLFATLGVLAGAGYTVRYPPMLSAEATVLLSPTLKAPSSQVFIASSDSVLQGAMPSVSPKMSLTALRNRIHVKSTSPNVITISAEGRTPVQAEDVANAVAQSYVDLLTSGKLPGQVVPAQVLNPANQATAASSVPVRMSETALLGAILGALIGAVTALGVSRSDRKLHERDEIAQSIGIPVLASILAASPPNSAGWKKLLEEYEPGPVDAWRLRKVLQHLSVDSSLTDGVSTVHSLSILSLSDDKTALALGPQLAVFAASVGIPTDLVIGPQQETNATAILRAACAAPPVPSRRHRNLRVTVSDHPGTRPPLDAELAIVVAVVDGRAPQFTGMVRTTATVLGVTAGAATAEQLARVAASAAADSRQLVGILVANSDPTDHTTGRLAQLAQPTRQTASKHTTGTTTETWQ